MIPGMNPRKMQQMMKQMGVQQEDLEANRVIIECPDMVLTIDNPQVAKVNMMGQETWQIIGEPKVTAVDHTPDISEEDVQTVMQQTDVSEEDARKAIEDAKGDLADAILKLSE